MNVEEIFSQLDPKLRKALSLGSEIQPVKYVESPSYNLNKSLGGGFPLGRQVLIWGNKSASKSSMCLQTVALAQKSGLSCAWIDAEMSFDPSWSSRLGIDNSSLIYSETRSINDMVDAGVGLMQAGVDVIVVDSISALLPAVYFEKDSSDLKQLENTKQIGAESRDFSNAWKMLNFANNRVKPTLLIIISQSRNNINSMYTQPIPQGGNATKFYSSTIIKLFSSESDNQAIKGKIESGDRVIEEKIGRKVRWEVQFSKTSPAFQTGEYDFYFKGDNIGIDSVADLVDTAELAGHIEKGGAWYTVLGERFQGRAKVVEWLRQNPDKVAELVQIIE